MIAYAFVQAFDWTSLLLDNRGVVAAILMGLITLAQSKIEMRQEMERQYIKLVKEQSERVKEVNAKLEQSEIERRESEKRISQQSIQIERLNDKADDLIKVNAELQSSNKEEREQFAAKLKAMQAHIDQQAAKIEQLESTVQKMERRHELDGKRIAALHRVIKKLRTLIKNTEKENKRLKAALRESNVRAETLEDQRDKLNAQLVKLEAKLQNTQNEVEQLREIVNTWEHRGDQHEQKNGIHASDGGAGADASGSGIRTKPDDATRPDA